MPNCVECGNHLTKIANRTYRCVDKTCSAYHVQLMIPVKRNPKKQPGGSDAKI